MRKYLFMLFLLVFGCASENLKQGCDTTAKVIEGIAVGSTDPQCREWAADTVPVARAVADHVGHPEQPLLEGPPDVQAESPPTSALAALAKRLNIETKWLNRLKSGLMSILDKAAVKWGFIGTILAALGVVARKWRRLRKAFVQTAVVIEKHAPEIKDKLKAAHGDLVEEVRPIVKEAKNAEGA